MELVLAVKVLVVGTGSIGRRHISSLRFLEPASEYVLVRRDAREDDYSRNLGAVVVSTLEEGLSLQPDLAVIANPSSLHCESLLLILAAGIPTYIEKPIVTDREQAEKLSRFLQQLAVVPSTIVGCVLRFLPSLIEMRRLIHDGEIGRPIRASLQVGQWLPSWRPNANYLDSYSANPDLGGGVVLDLIHEVDMVRWLFGEFDTLLAHGGSYSSLKLKSEDAAVIVLGRQAGPVVAVSLDYVSRVPVRHYEVIGDEGTICWDLRQRKLSIETPEKINNIELSRDAFDIGGAHSTAMNELLVASRTGSSTKLDIFEGLRSAWLAIKANEMIRS